MGTISRQYTFVAGAVPTSTNWNADWSNIITLANGQIDKANVDSASTDGIVTMDETQTISGVKTWTGAQTTKAAVTVGVDDTGHDVKFFGATSGAYCLWDESADDLKLVGAAGLTVAGTSALTVTTVSGASQFNSTVTVGVDDTGYDVKFFGATASAYCLWDESADDLKLVGAAGLTVAGTSALTVLTASTITGSGVLSIDDTTESTSTTTGSIHTDGGLGVVGDIYAGDDIFLTAAGVLNWGGGDVTVTGGTNLLTFAGGVINLGTNAGAGIAHTDGTFHVHTATAGTVAAGGGAEDLVIEGGNATGMTLLSPDANSTQIYFGSPTDNDGGQVTYFYNSGAPYMAFATGSTERMRIDSGGTGYINDTANGSMTVGMTINQGANDNEILALKSSDVAHAMTDHADADTYGAFQKVESTSGGLYMRGFKDADGNAFHAVHLQGLLGEAAQTTDTTDSKGIVEISGEVTNDGSNTQAAAATGNIVSIGTFGTTRVIFKGNGTVHASDTSWATALDDMPDAIAGRALVTQSGLLDGYKIHAPELVQKMEDAGIVTHAELPGEGSLPGHRFLNLQKGIKFSWDMGFQNFSFLYEIAKVLTSKQRAKLPQQMREAFTYLERAV